MKKPSEVFCFKKISEGFCVKFLYTYTAAAAVFGYFQAGD